MPVRKKLWSSNLEDGVDIAITHGKYQVEAEFPVTVGQQFQSVSIKYPDRIALKYKQGATWSQVSYSKYFINCIKVAKTFMKLGLQRSHGVAIMGFNSPEWFYSNFGAIFAGGVSVGMSTRSTPEECQFILEDCKANIVVVEDKDQLDKILQIRSALPDLKAIIQYKETLSQEYENVYDWNQFLEVGKYESEKKVEEMINVQRPTHCCAVLYTPGTAGKPRGVMFSHDNLTWTAKAHFRHISPTVGFPEGAFTEIISYLPLSHISGQMAEIYCSLYMGSTVYFAEADFLKGYLEETVSAIKPFMFLGTPKVWEKLMEGIQVDQQLKTGMKKKMKEWASSKAYRACINIQKRQPLPWGMTLANKILKPVKERCGLENALLTFVTFDRVQSKMVEFFMKYDIPLLEMYGMTECSGLCNLSSIDAWKLGSAGRAMCGTKVKILEPDSNGEGEILIYGRHVFMGYLNDQKRTREAIDYKGWLHSGDIGKIDIDGFLTVVGRLTDTIITAGGEKILLTPLEDKIKAAIPFLSNVVIIGNQRNYLTCLVTLKCLMDLDTDKPTDTVHPTVFANHQDLACGLTSVSIIAQQKTPSIMNKIQEGLVKVNKTVPSILHSIEKFALLESDFSVAGGELGPTLKVKRHAILEKYASIIDSLY